jgi:hypothetical protein
VPLPVGFLTFSVAVEGEFAVVADLEGRGGVVAVSAGGWRRGGCCCLVVWHHGDGCLAVLSGGVVRWCWMSCGRRLSKAIFMLSLSRPVSVAASPEAPQALRKTSLVWRRISECLCVQLLADVDQRPR